MIMARTIQEIESEIIAAKEAQSQLDSLTSSSQTAIWRLWVYVIAVAHLALESLWDIFKIEVNELVASRRLGTPPWYVNIAKEFQLGDDLLETGLYAVIDESKRIITRASFKEDDIESVLTLKVAKGVETPTALSTEELSQFRTYIQELKFAGTKVSVISLNADLLRGNLTVYYDGILNANATLTNIKQAIRDYLANLPFDGVLLRNELIEKIREVSGVEDCEVVSLRGVQGSTSYNIDRLYESQAGYIELDEDGFIINLIIA
jgi:hypothetical protein